MVEILTELKKLFKKLKTDTSSILFTQETINEKLIKKLKESKYDKDKQFVKLKKVFAAEQKLN